jgi:hypothetical protein
VAFVYIYIASTKLKNCMRTKCLLTFEASLILYFCSRELIEFLRSSQMNKMHDLSFVYVILISGNHSKYTLDKLIITS